MNNKELFEKINEILLKSLKPSEDLERLIIEGYLDKEPFNKIKKLNNIEQNPKYHPEGSVLKHVLLVVDLASEYKKYSNDENDPLLHDISRVKALPHFLMSLISLAAPYIDGSNLFQLIVMEAHRHSPSVTTHCSSAKSKNCRISSQF